MTRLRGDGARGRERHTLLHSRCVSLGRASSSPFPPSPSPRRPRIWRVRATRGVSTPDWRPFKLPRPCRRQFIHQPEYLSPAVPSFGGRLAPSIPDRASAWLLRLFLSLRNTRRRSSARCIVFVPATERTVYFFFRDDHFNFSRYEYLESKGNLLNLRSLKEESWSFANRFTATGRGFLEKNLLLNGSSLDRTAQMNERKSTAT